VNDFKVKPSTGVEFTIRRTFAAKLDRVWRAWTEPEQMAKWWGPKGYASEIVKLDLRPGGICHYRLVSPDGQEMWGKLLYHEILPRERLVFITSFSDPQEGLTTHPLSPDWPREMMTTVTFSEKADKTTVMVHWVPYEASDTERAVFEAALGACEAGWTGTFEQLEDYLAKL
jgi:uncharacterized protein YndB with AHSA1/START domain